MTLAGRLPRLPPSARRRAIFDGHFLLAGVIPYEGAFGIECFPLVLPFTDEDGRWPLEVGSRVAPCWRPLPSAAGAIGTHVLKEVLELPPRELETFDVAVRYQTGARVGLILVGLLIDRNPSRLLSAGGWACCWACCCSPAAFMPGFFQA